MGSQTFLLRWLSQKLCPSKISLSLFLRLDIIKKKNAHVLLCVQLGPERRRKDQKIKEKREKGTERNWRNLRGGNLRGPDP